MKAFILLIFVPSIISADTPCPNSKITCPEDKQCCEVDGVYSCCDPEDDQDIPEIRKKVFPGVEIMSADVFENGSFSVNESTLQFGLMCDLFCSGTCCEAGCCSYSRATCCKDGCCPETSTCCSDNRCCPNLTQCCRRGCCPKMSTCCGSGCCAYGTICCGSWCCPEGDRCGPSFETCINKGATIFSDIAVLLWLAVSLLVSHHF
ncbi:hypothetical protein AVEN_92143-1 [Araneus ventricosus]|uniref:Granulins n=1 Tax=Araneus ventricosus TaxID=182803 RepID=A0A4Y2GAQ8_ARAVE|nr:hypothetical protein AVEN_92143-1 [Araneus ventricosus]